MAARGKMTAKQAAFVREFLLDFNATAAAKRAGYSARTAEQIGYQLLQHPSVRAAVEAGKATQAARAEITKDWLIQQAAEDYRDAKTAKAHSAARGALELIAKLTGNLVERRETRRVTSWSDLTDAELEALKAEWERTHGARH